MTDNLPEHIDPPSGFPVPPDMTQILKFDAMVDEVNTINALNGPFYIGEFLKAMNVSLSYHSRSISEYENAMQEAKTRFAVAMLDKAPTALRAKDIRPNEEFCKQYAHMDEEYLKAKEIEGYWKSLTRFLELKYERFKCAHDDAKKIYDQVRAPRGSSGALPTGRDAY